MYMIGKIFSAQSKTITGAAIVLGAASLASRFMGLIRDRIFTHTFGAGNILDSYYAAFRIPDFIYNLLIVGALSAGFIPVFVKLINRDKEEAWKVTNSLINILMVTMAVVCGILFIFTPQITPYLVPGFDAEKIKMTILFTRIMFLSPILLGISGIVGGVLQSTKNFLIYSLTPIMYNLGIIIGALVFVPSMGISGLAWGVVLGALLHLSLQLPSLYKQGFHYQKLFLWKNPYVREIGKLMIPRTLGLASNQLNLIIITVLASTLASGSITVFNLANNLQYFPIGIIGVSFAIAAFPTLSELFAKDKKEELINNLSSTIRQILFFIIPITILFLLLRAQIVRVTYGSGKFDWNATVATADVLAFFALSLFAQCLIPLLARAFYAMHNTWIPFAIGILCDITNIFVGIYFKNILGITGLAISFSISMLLQMVVLWIMLHRKLGTLQEGKVLFSLLKISAGALFMGLIIQLLKTPLANIVDMQTFWGVFTQGLVAGLAGLIVYSVILYFLRLEEMLQFGASMKRRWLRLWNVTPEISE